MNTFLITLLGFLVVILLMSVGVIFSNRRIKGSCGGLGAAMGDPQQACDFCGKKSECLEKKQMLCEENTDCSH